MAGKKLIAVVGITGTQGSSVATHFLKHPNWRIRGITRNPESSKAKAWAAKGVELFKGDLDNIDSIKSAFVGAHAIFGVTDYFGNWTRVDGSDDLKQKAKEAGRTNDEYAADLERAQGTNIAKAASDPEVLQTLEHFVWSTLAAVSRISEGKYTHAYEFDSKSDVERQIREEIPELNKRLSTVTLGVYQETWADIPAFSPHKNADGTFTFVNLKWPGSEKPQPQVIASRDTGAFVNALVNEHAPGVDVLGASEIISREDYAATWAKVVGQKASVKEIDEEEYAKYLPAEIKDTMIDLFKFFPTYGYAGPNPKVKTPAELGIKTTPLAEFMKDQDYSDIINGK